MVNIMIEIRKDSLEAKVIHILKEVYPVTVTDVSKELGIHEGKVELAIKRLAMKGVVELEKLEDKTFIRLVRRDFHMIGSNSTQERSLKRRSGRKAKRASPQEYDGDMFG